MPEKDDPFSVKAWTIGTKIPCPECYQWTSAANIARHCKKEYDLTKDTKKPHSPTKEELFASEKNYEAARTMYLRKVSGYKKEIENE